MPAPPSYYDVTAVPFSHTFTQADFNAGTYGGSVNTLWLRRIVTGEVGAQVALGIFTNQGGTFKADTTIYESDGSTVVKAVTGASNVSMYAIVPVGTYYIQIVRHGGGASDFDFTTQIDEVPADAPLTAGQLLINDDSSGFPATVLNADGSVAGFRTNIPAGETAAFLPTGESLWHDRFGLVGGADRMALYNANLAFVASFDLLLTGTLPVVAHSDTDFYIVDRAAGDLWKITGAGVGTNLGVALSAIPSAIAVDPAGLILYWTEASGAAAIHRFDLVLLTAITDLSFIGGLHVPADDTLAMTPNGHPGDLILLPDGTFVTWYYSLAFANWQLVHLSAAGATILGFSFGGGGIDHLFDLGESDFIGLWQFTTVGLDEGRIGRVDLSTGAFSSDFTSPLFNSGENLQTDEDTLFAPSASCTIFSIGVATSTPPTPVEPGPDEGIDEIIGPLLVIHMRRNVPVSAPEPEVT